VDDHISAGRFPESRLKQAPATGRPSAPRSHRRPPSRPLLFAAALPAALVAGAAGAAGAAVVIATHGGHAPSGTAEAAAGLRDTATGTATGTALDAAARERAAATARAGRDRRRADLRAREAAARRARAAERARREALRPRFVLPVTQHGLSAYFGQAGVHWMTVHTGIDFPVAYGTPVRAATDGTVSTRWNPAYGTMAIVTAPDGTTTWYCHLSSTRIRSGSVHAGTVIAYSGDSGNTTGPHLHFEVHPHGGPAADPLPWLLSHHLDPR
jgi:murein DD-endopeptidase MepM/ murein hydrolase activator NlpD